MFNRKLAMLKTAAVLIGCLGAVGSSWATSKTTTFQVNANVVQKCTISATNVTLANYDPIGANASAALDTNSAGSSPGSVSLTCTKGSGSTVAVTIGLDTGSNFASATNGSTRALANNATGGPYYLNYDLYMPSATTPSAACANPVNSMNVWGTSGINLFQPSGVTWGSTAGPQTFAVCGSIPGSQDAVQGNYTDTITATVNF
jgi:spore coat protein U-like protein